MSPSRVRAAGDAGLLIELDERIDPAIGDAVVAIAAALRDAAVPGIRDIVPTYRSVAIHIDPHAVDGRLLRDAIERARLAPPADGERRTIEIPVRYGGRDGPDLDAIAAAAGLTAAETIARHAAPRYHVFMLGFLPGFPYMGVVDERIAAPRRAIPRARVPAGSVGIAGRQTGIYPQASPGGWQIIGRTGVRLFDPARTPAALLRPGDRVRVVPDRRADDDTSPPAPAPRASAGPDVAARTVTVLRPGLLTTVQDGGRWGHQASGVPVSGALDSVAHRIANALVGNDRDAAGLEVTLVGPELRLETPATVAVAGADLEATIDGAAVPLHVAMQGRAGSVLRFGARRSGARAYIAFDGGIAVPPLLGSRSTHLLSGLGGLGRALAAGDRLPLGERRVAPRRRRVDLPPVPAAGGARVRVLPGPQAETFFAPDVLDRLQALRFRIAPQSDRMGYRLTGGRLARLGDREMISDATFAGALQVPPAGEPILLMADRQTTGGYPQAALVITADLPVVAQLAPGDWLAFEPSTHADAIAALVVREGTLLAIE